MLCLRAKMLVLTSQWAQTLQIPYRRRLKWDPQFIEHPIIMSHLAALNPEP